MAQKESAMKTATHLILSLLHMAFCLKAGQAGKTLQSEICDLIGRISPSSAGAPVIWPNFPASPFSALAFGMTPSADRLRFVSSGSGFSPIAEYRFGSVV
jgi:hypothetical protein